MKIIDFEGFQGFDDFTTAVGLGPRVCHENLKDFEDFNDFTTAVGLGPRVCHDNFDDD